MKVLYLSYDGMLEPLGQSQVLQYVKKLALDHTITLISYEKKHDWDDKGRRNALIDEVRRAGIEWHPLRYHKRPTALATSYDICIGLVLAGWLVWRRKIQIVHARSYVVSATALVLKAVFGVKFIFDMRGFWADEKADNGDWIKGSILYRVAKWFEQRFLLAADRIISLTQAAVDEMGRLVYLQGRTLPIEVITTCTNLEHFRRYQVGRAGSAGPTTFTLGYVGSATFSYLFDETLECFKLLREMEPTAKLLVLNCGQHEYIKERIARHRIDGRWAELRMAGFIELPNQYSRMDAGMFFIRRTYSKIAMAPTKLGEFLACGVPCLSNAGVGDMTSILEGERVGVILRNFDPDSMKVALGRLLALARSPETRERCRLVAGRYFSLESGVRSYDRIYRSLGGCGLDAR